MKRLLPYSYCSVFLRIKANFILFFFALILAAGQALPLLLDGGDADRVVFSQGQPAETDDESDGAEISFTEGDLAELYEASPRFALSVCKSELLSEDIPLSYFEFQLHRPPASRA